MIGNETIFAMNKVKKLAVVYTIMAVINLIGAAILAKPFGAIGISVSVCFAYIVRTIGMDVIFTKICISILSNSSKKRLVLCLFL